jgi:hypothetical protein
MRSFAFLWLFTALTPSVFASTHVTIEQLEQLLIAAHGKPDTKVAEQLSDIELTYIVDIAVDAHSLTFAEQPDGTHRTQIEYATAAYDAGTKHVNCIDRGVQLTISAEQFAQTLSTGIPLRLALDIPTGQIALRVAVFDPATSHAGSLEIPMTVAAR